MNQSMIMRLTVSEELSRTIHARAVMQGITISAFVENVMTQALGKLEPVPALAVPEK